MTEPPYRARRECAPLRIPLFKRFQQPDPAFLDKFFNDKLAHDSVRPCVTDRDLVAPSIVKHHEQFTRAFVATLRSERDGVFVLW